MKKSVAIFITVLILALVIFIGAKMTGNIVNVNTINQNILETKMTEETKNQDTTGDKVKLETNHGDIVIELYDEMPITAGNFKKLVEEGFYDSVIFHRVIDGFMLQGGDPTGTGMGGPGYNIDDEFVDGISNLRGTLSMANSGPNTGGSQFFINLVDNTGLDWDKPPMQSKHPVFGKVVEGMDVVDKIAKIQTDGNPPQGNSKPLQDVVIKKASLM